MGEKKRVIVFITWLIIAVSSVPFERINDDEALYFLEARHILTAGPVAHFDLIFVPQILGALASGVYDSLLAARTLSAIAVLATAILIYYTKKDNASFIASMLYLTSFLTIRFGLRFFLDPFGGFFTIAAIYCLYKTKSELTGVSAALAVFSREITAPLFPIFLFIAYRRKVGLRKFLLGAAPVLLFGVVWIYLSIKSGSALTANATQLQNLSTTGVSSFSVSGVAKGWLEYVLISPLVVLGLAFAGTDARRWPEFYPMIFSFAILSIVPGFIQNGAATEYPYVFNTIACLTAGVGLERLYQMLRLDEKKLLKIIVLLLVVQFLGQSYLASALTVNQTVGVQDYGYWYDQRLLSYMNNHYDGGAIYSSNLDCLLENRLAADLAWVPQNITPALVNNPPWLITYGSYVIIETVPANATVVTIGPYIVIHQDGVALSSFVELSNRTNRFP